MKHKLSFKKTVYITWETPENGEPFMVVHDCPESVAEVFNDVKVGIYKLVRIGIVKTTAVLE